MTPSVCKLAAVLPALFFAACTRPTPPTAQAASAATPADAPRAKREVRITGIVQAVHSVKVTVPQIQGQFSNMTLTKLIPNGSRVQEGDLIATFDATQQMDAGRDAQAKFEDLGHQAEQKIAENRANAEKRTADLRQAEADLAKAELELQKGPTLAEIDRLKNEARAAGARTHLESLKKSGAFREKTEVAALRILELQRDRQKIAMQRAADNIRKLEIHAPLAGMVAHEMTYRGGSYGRAQEGDQLYRTYPLVSIFEPSEMQVRCAVNEPDVLALLPRSPASVYLDAYPELALPVHFVSSSPVASSALGTPIKNFVAIFRIDRPDPHLLPDLSAAVVLEPPPSPVAAAGGAK
jgi:multidrug resistance efflux pump